MAKINLQARQKAERHILRAIKELDNTTAVKLLRSLADDLDPTPALGTTSQTDMGQFVIDGSASRSPMSTQTW